MGIVVTIKKRQLLLAVGGIVGGIQIDRDPPRPTMQPLAMPLDHRIGQCFRDAKQCLAIHTVFKTRERRLRSQVFSPVRIPTHQQFVHRIRAAASSSESPATRPSQLPGDR
jgi:hypothetical protein